MLFRKKGGQEGRDHTSLMELTGFYVLYFVTENHGMQGRMEDLRFLGRKGGEETTKRERERDRRKEKEGEIGRKEGKKKREGKSSEERMIDTDIEDRMGELNIRSNF